MLASRIYSQEPDINARLTSFGVTRNELIKVVRNALAERANAVDVDPLNTRGQFSYIHGTRHLRWLFLSKGWLIDRERNVESVLHPSRSLKVAYQNVDLAASLVRAPRAISGKRAGAAKIIEDAQGSLFPNGDLPEAIDPGIILGLRSSVWYLCASFTDDDVSAELSLPAAVKNGNFHGFLERIFLIQGGNCGDVSIPDDEAAVEFEPQIARR